MEQQIQLEKYYNALYEYGLIYVNNTSNVAL